MLTRLGSQKLNQQVIIPTAEGQGTSWVQNVLVGTDIVLYSIKEGNSGNIYISSLVMVNGYPISERLSDASFNIAWSVNKIKGAFISNNKLYVIGYYTSTTDYLVMGVFSLNNESYGDPTYIESVRVQTTPGINTVMFDPENIILYTYNGNFVEKYLLDDVEDTLTRQGTGVSVYGNYSAFGWNPVTNSIYRSYSYSNSQHLYELSLNLVDGELVDTEVHTQVGIFSAKNLNYGSFPNRFYSYNATDSSIDTHEAVQVGGMAQAMTNDSKFPYYIKIK